MILLIFITHAHAAETVILQHQDLRLTVPRSELHEFADTGELSPSLEEFFQTTQQVPTEIRRQLTTNIPVQVATLVPTDFVLYEVNKALGDPLGREQLDPLRTMFRNAIQDDQSISIIELLEHYPAESVRLDVGRLDKVYSDVELFLTRIQPILSVADQLVPELLCNCQQGATARQTLQNAYATLDTTVLTQPASTKAIIPVSTSSIAQTTAQITAQTTAQTTTATNLDREVVFSAGILRRSLTIGDLITFTETGNLPSGWQFFLNLANVDSEHLRTALTREVAVKQRFLDKTLNSLLGELLLYEASQVVHTRSDLANIQALRSALVLATAEDDRFSILELLQQYPTLQIIVEVPRLARLGQRVSDLRSIESIGQASIALEDWLLHLQASAAEQICTCDAETQDASQSVTERPSQLPPEIPPTITNTTTTNVSQFLPASWQPVSPHREDFGSIKVIWLQGTPYDMGYQHGQFLHDEIASLGSDAIDLLRLAGRGFALSQLATNRSYPNVVEECRGMAAATADLGMTQDACMVLAYGDVLQEFLGYTLPEILFWEGCSQFVASGNATVDDRLYHGSSLDNDKKPIDYIVNNPVLFVRQPKDGMPHVFISYPGVLWPNWGVNVAGISLGLDTAHASTLEELSLYGGSNVQLMAEILNYATRFEDARSIMESQPRARANIIMIADGKSKQAGVFEFTAKALGIRTLPESGVLYATNHFVDSTVEGKQPVPNQSSVSRFDRYKQLLEPNQPNSTYGSITPEVMTQILRDRTNPYTMESSPLDVFDDDASPGGNGALRQGLYDPERLLIWIAAGEPPVPENPFRCFSVGQMLGFPDAATCPGPEIE